MMLVTHKGSGMATWKRDLKRICEGAEYGIRKPESGRKQYQIGKECTE